MSTTASTQAATHESPSSDAEGLPLWRLHAMKVGYAVMGVVALPAATAGLVDKAKSEVIVSCSLVAIVLAVLTWRYVGQRYVLAKGDRWR